MERKFWICRSTKRSGRKKVPTWTHTFVCMSSLSQETPPDYNERALLQIAGLGEKRVTILANSEAPEVYEELVVA